MAQTIKNFLKFYFNATTLYNVHSPFVYSLVHEVFNGKLPIGLRTFINLRRNEFLSSNDRIQSIDYGAGSRSTSPSKDVAIRQIAKTAVSDNLKCRWLYNLTAHLRPDYVVELGTSLGVSAVHLSWSGAKVTTMEGNPSIAAIANETFRLGGLTDQITLLTGRFDESLKSLKKTKERPDLIYIDGNHTYEATMRYFHWFNEWRNGTEMVLIFDDIYWSPGMMQAWSEISVDSAVSLSIDLYQLGVVFLNNENFSPDRYRLVPYRWKPWHIGFRPV